MISVKGGTQTWSNSAQKVDYKSDGAQNLSATDKAKALGGEDSIGDVLNKVADPGYVPEEKKAHRVGNPELGKDAFMSLLLTQMKNQDPTNPLKSHEMAAQLAQFTQLEKLNNINDSISGLRKDQQPDHNFQALSFIGKSIATDNSKVTHLDKDARHEVRFTLPADAPQMTIQVKDAEGKVVRTMDQKNLRTGANEVAWNGMTDEGNAAPIGEYTLNFDATGSNGRKLHIETKTEGIITGVNFTAQGPQLMVGKQVVNMSEVKSISQPNIGGAEAAPIQPNGNGAIAIPPIPGSGGGAPKAAPAAAMGAQNQNSLQSKAMASAAQGGLPPGMTPEDMQKAMSAMAGKMFPGGTAAPMAGAHAQGPKKAEVKPETKANAAKAAKMGKGNINDASMAQGLINKLEKDGAKAGMGS